MQKKINILQTLKKAVTVKNGWILPTNNPKVLIPDTNVCAKLKENKYSSCRYEMVWTDRQIQEGIT